MRAYCEEAKQYGDELQNVLYPNKKLVVVLNPAADKKNAEESVSISVIFIIVGIRIYF